MLKGKLVELLDEKNAERRFEGKAELNTAERLKLIETRMETNKVYIDDAGFDSIVPVFMLNRKEREDAYVKVGGVNVGIATLDKSLSNAETKKRIYAHMDKDPKIKAREYGNIGIAMWELGNKDKIRKADDKITKGTIKHADGGNVLRSSVIDTLSRTPLKTLKGDDFKRDLKKLYGTDGLELLDFVIKKKQ